MSEDDDENRETLVRGFTPIGRVPMDEGEYRGLTPIPKIILDSEAPGQAGLTPQPTIPLPEGENKSEGAAE